MKTRYPTPVVARRISAAGFSILTAISALALIAVCLGLLTVKYGVVHSLAKKDYMAQTYHEKDVLQSTVNGNAPGNANYTIALSEKTDVASGGYGTIANGYTATYTGVNTTAPNGSIFYTNYQGVNRALYVNGDYAFNGQTATITGFPAGNYSTNATTTNHFDANIHAPNNLNVFVTNAASYGGTRGTFATINIGAANAPTGPGTNANTESL